jgi:hypothetical protein
VPGDHSSKYLKKCLREKYFIHWWTVKRNFVVIGMIKDYILIFLLKKFGFGKLFSSEQFEIERYNS